MIYRYELKPKSPIITPLMSDTFFGHFCWAMLYRKGEQFLKDFLESYDVGKPGPVLFSSAFPSGYLPRPALPSPSRDKMRKFVRDNYGEKKENIFLGLSDFKKWNKQQYISVEQWMKLKHDYSDLGLYEIIFLTDRFLTDQPDHGKNIIKDVTASNTINRSIGTVQEGGGFFQREKTWYRKDVSPDPDSDSDPALDLYVELNDDFSVDLTDWFLVEFLPQNGFGADKSTGMGSLSVENTGSVAPDLISDPDSNAQLSLSLASFPGIETYDAYYHLKTKFGKLGGSFAFSSPTGGNPKPFKKPVLMYEPGAVFFCDHSLGNRPLLKNVHSEERIRHAGIPVTLPFRIKM